MDDLSMEVQPAGTTFHVLSADEQLKAARTVLVEHVTLEETGRCAKCGSSGPCWRRENAIVVFSRTLRLPTPRPGPSRPEALDMVGAGRRPLPMAG
ncbi:hypothetical protein [Actinoplanes sp. NPDC020271]|uniref:hypothetical protein n=1 Tax=Actinoplanes sp. NPDC020271 TaxID=3363896 RepID=UPI0037A991BC